MSAAEPDTQFTQEGLVPLEAGSGTRGSNVEVDERGEGHDSTLSSGQSSATTSVSSSVFCFTYANGRRYHSDRFKLAEYFMPNDEPEQDRLDLYHHIFLSLVGGKLHLAPLEEPQKVLDVGTGTGLWAIDFADENPQAEVIGVDISPIQPHWVPPNLKFEVEDVEEEWTFEKNYFDFIHLRSMSGSFSEEGWDKLLEQSYHKLKPGGYIEYQDYSCQVYLSDGTHLTEPSEKYPVGNLFYNITHAAAKIGRPLTVATTMKERLETAGFVDVSAQKAIWPLGAWPKDKRLKELGKWGMMGAMDSFYPFGLGFLPHVGWSVEKIKETTDKASKDLSVGKYYTYGYFVYGRKPEY